MHKNLGDSDKQMFKQSKVLYLHGFKSSPQSVKAQQTQSYLIEYFPNIEFFCPQLPCEPLEAIKVLEGIICTYSESHWHFIGSSLGGFYATYLSEKYQCKAVLINPAVKPYLLLQDYLGEHINPYTNEAFTVTSRYIEDLYQLSVQDISQKQYLLMVQQGDEVLDYQQAVDKYQGNQLIIQQGGDHSFVNYDKMLPVIKKFLCL